MIDPVRRALLPSPSMQFITREEEKLHLQKHGSLKTYSSVPKRKISPLRGPLLFSTPTDRELPLLVRRVLPVLAPSLPTFNNPPNRLFRPLLYFKAGSSLFPPLTLVLPRTSSLLLPRNKRSPPFNQRGSFLRTSEPALQPPLPLPSQPAPSNQNI